MDTASRGTPESPQARADRWQPRLADPVHAPTLRRLALATEPVTARQTVFVLTALSGLAFWAEETGVPINELTLTDPELIARYEQLGMPGSIFPVRRRARDLLDRVSEAHRGAAAPPRPPGDAKRAYAKPYDSDDVDRLLRWGGAQRSNLKRHALLAILGCGLGAGLSRADLKTVTGNDVISDPEGTVTVRVGGKAPRRVTVLRRYESLLLDLACQAGDDWLVAPGLLPDREDPLRWHWEQAAQDSRTPDLTLRRARITWQCTHLALGTRLDILANAAGLASGQILGQQRLTQITQEPPDQARRHLREATHPPDPAQPLAGRSEAYTRSEVTSLLAWAATLPGTTADPDRRRHTFAALATGLGTGLARRDLQHLTGRDITTHPETGEVIVTITRDGTQRRVTCLHEHEALLTDVAQQAGDRPLVTDQSLSREWPDQLLHGVPAPEQRRSRATWLRAHLASGTRLDTLTRAAGLTGPSNLYLAAQALDPPPDAQRRRILRGP